ncbi:MAG: hypothetical protein QG583_155 [Patescibacteria group bacterium]|nr:hypothetical protein [Patescibacteria group bacterium]
MKFVRYVAVVLFIIWAMVSALGQSVSANPSFGLVLKMQNPSHYGDVVAVLSDTVPSPGKIVLPNRFFMPCQDDYAVVDTLVVLFIDDEEYVFIGSISTSYTCCHNEQKSLIIMPNPNALEVNKELLRWKNMYIGDSFYLDKGLGGNYASVFVEKSELIEAGLLKE